MSSSVNQFTPKLISQLREGYGWSDFRADAIAGLTVAIVALPLSMAIAIASGLSPDKGIYTAIIGGFIISALGGSRYQIGGPAGAFIVLISSVVARHGYDGLVLATFIAGLMMMIAGWLRLGNLIRHIPQAVLVGFTAGIAIIIFGSQIKELLGITLGNDPAALLPKLLLLASSITEAKPSTIGIATLSLAIIIGLKRYFPNWPNLLIAVILSSLVTLFLHLDVATIGTRFGAVPNGLPAPTMPDFSVEKVIKIFPDAMAIMLLGAIESLLSAKVADGMTGRKHRSNGELVAQGLANMAAVTFGGMCVTGTIARTATNIRAGAISPISGMLHAVYLLLFIMIAAPLAAHIPLASLAAILTIVCWNMADKHDFLLIASGNRGNAVVLLATFLLTIFVDLIVGIAVGTALGLLINRDHAVDDPSRGSNP